MVLQLSPLVFLTAYLVLMFFVEMGCDTTTMPSHMYPRGRESWVKVAGRGKMIVSVSVSVSNRTLLSIILCSLLLLLLLVSLWSAFPPCKVAKSRVAISRTRLRSQVLIRLHIVKLERKKNSKEKRNSEKWEEGFKRKEKVALKIKKSPDEVNEVKL